MIVKSINTVKQAKTCESVLRKLFFKAYKQIYDSTLIIAVLYGIELGTLYMLFNVCAHVHAVRSASSKHHFNSSTEQ